MMRTLGIAVVFTLLTGCGGGDLGFDTTPTAASTPSSTVTPTPTNLPLPPARATLSCLVIDGTPVIPCPTDTPTPVN